MSMAPSWAYASPVHGHVHHGPMLVMSMAYSSHVHGPMLVMSIMSFCPWAYASHVHGYVPVLMSIPYASHVPMLVMSMLHGPMLVMSIALC
ncbi:hypothetical protein CEXT_438401 [Caerostris extrusa]|uniref:Uncharacterized protein n=1 Tax=Caerostris extrusa TaxID=172846 RepID=A0AAV4T0U7_CAEEX|nr:hypothetical protein CEXT_438401 [Caerostris extrusa]